LKIDFLLVTMSFLSTYNLYYRQTKMGILDQIIVKATTDSDGGSLGTEINTASLFTDPSHLPIAADAFGFVSAALVPPSALKVHGVLAREITAVKSARASREMALRVLSPDSELVKVTSHPVDVGLSFKNVPRGHPCAWVRDLVVAKATHVDVFHGDKLHIDELRTRNGSIVLRKCDWHCWGSDNWGGRTKHNSIPWTLCHSQHAVWTADCECYDECWRIMSAIDSADLHEAVEVNAIEESQVNWLDSAYTAHKDFKVFADELEELQLREEELITARSRIETDGGDTNDKIVTLKATYDAELEALRRARDSCEAEYPRYCNRIRNNGGEPEDYNEYLARSTRNQVEASRNTFEALTNARNRQQEVTAKLTRGFGIIRDVKIARKDLEERLSVSFKLPFFLAKRAINNLSRIISHKSKTSSGGRKYSSPRSEALMRSLQDMNEFIETYRPFVAVEDEESVYTEVDYDQKLAEAEIAAIKARATTEVEMVANLWGDVVVLDTDGKPIKLTEDEIKVSHATIVAVNSEKYAAMKAQNNLPELDDDDDVDDYDDYDDSRHFRRDKYAGYAEVATKAKTSRGAGAGASDDGWNTKSSGRKDKATSRGGVRGGW
jgi:hypothetical protein